ncbi:hypothetical protein EKE94_17470 [Mesobaculum littorinae]|uniref:L,D-TPase catalytic domain-containing protein n=1 Tax=Mesobaculum littorinae TaxID=2486419 RepID=A0A438AD93_9RHOB|nr:L,D-transpeptidase family protein [Mesobaculum littorinae]RVV96670.1 hypothetical protein EKE94_17470 [Mesobaculum littorinae]
MTDLRLTPRGLFAFGHRLPCTIGRGGVVTTKREGDGGTPAGTWRIEACLYRPDRMPAPAPWARPIGPRDLWSDDPADPNYNGPVQAPHAYSHERLRRGDALYDLILVTDWNRHPAGRGRGSAIFLHRWRGPARPTEGCIAMAPGDLLWLARNAPPGTPLAVPAGLPPRGG